MNNRTLCFLEWVVYDNCNLDCSYCVNKGEFSQKVKEEMLYSPGTEVEIAKRFVEISKGFKRTIVSLSGGEPTAAKYFKDVLSVLRTSSTIEVKLITNMKKTDWVETYSGGLSDVLVSLHVRYRDDEDIDRLIDATNRVRQKTHITLSQVDYKLSSEDRKKLARIESSTGLPIEYQTFIPPWTNDGEIENAEEIRNANFQSSRGKRCSLGYIYFFVYPNGAFKYDLWCNNNTDNMGNLLDLAPTDFSQYVLDDMKKCSFDTCGCNYNYFQHAAYMEEARLNGYPELELFGGSNIRWSQRIMRKFTRLRVKLKR